jgi:hypothetical protein
VNRLLESIVVDALSSYLSWRRIPSLWARRWPISVSVGSSLVCMTAPTTIGPWSASQWSPQRRDRRFRVLVGEPPLRYLTRLRLQRAARLFRTTDSSVAEIARRVGYDSDEALSRAFKNRFGVSPSATRTPAIHSTN